GATVGTFAGGGRLVATGNSPGGGRRLGAAVVGIDGVIGAGSESAILSATSTVAITLVTAGWLTGVTCTRPELSTMSADNAIAPSHFWFGSSRDSPAAPTT